MTSLFWAALLCAPPTLAPNADAWTDDRGRAVLARARVVCAEQYHGCVARAERLSLTNFHVTCRRYP
jgi:hypothetical protein